MFIVVQVVVVVSMSSHGVVWLLAVTIIVMSTVVAVVYRVVRIMLQSIFVVAVPLDVIIGWIVIMNMIFLVEKQYDRTDQKHQYGIEQHAFGHLDMESFFRFEIGA